MKPQSAVPASTRLLGRIWPFCSLFASTPRPTSPTSSHWATCPEPLPTGITLKILTQHPGGYVYMFAATVRDKDHRYTDPLSFCFGCWVLTPREPPALGHASSRDRPMVFSPDRVPL